MFARLAAVLLTLNLVGMLFSLWCALFGPWQGLAFGATGFLIGIGALAFGDSKRGREMFQNLPQGLSRQAPFLRGLRGLLGLLIVLFVSASIMAGVVMACASGSDGLGDQRPVFKARPSYELNSHGERTKVSRLRYLVVNTGFFVAWHSGTALPTVFSLYYVLFGELPGPLRTRREAA